jgi:hypothetical protein
MAVCGDRTGVTPVTVLADDVELGQLASSEVVEIRSDAWCGVVV